MHRYWELPAYPPQNKTINISGSINSSHQNISIVMKVSPEPKKKKHSLKHRFTMLRADMEYGL